MKQLSRSVLFVNSNPKNEQIAVLKSKDMLNQLDTNVFQKNLIDSYQHRLGELHSRCLAEFAAIFVSNYQSSNDNEYAYRK